MHLLDTIIILTRLPIGKPFIVFFSFKLELILSHMMVMLNYIIAIALITL